MTRTVSAFSSEKDSAQVAAALIQQIEQAIPVPDVECPAFFVPVEKR